MENRRDNSGVLFKSDKKDNERAPDYKGNIMVDGQEYWLSAWIKEGKTGKFMGLAVSPRDAQPPASKPMPKNLDDDSIPFQSMNIGGKADADTTGLDSQMSVQRVPPPNF